ncbi:MAG TPA: DUF1398 domain-containing protein [Stellaceae bacterium]
MDTNLIALFHECSAGSIAETDNFSTVVGKLIAAGAEGYHCDLYRREKTYYMPDGRTHVEPEPELDPAEFGANRIAHDFSEARIKAALASVQTGSIIYVEFLRQIMVAGCVGYQVCITGRRALYFGRAGEVYVERFPSGN